MIWLTWRQHRLKLFGLGAVFFAAAAVYLAMGLGMRGSLPAVDLPHCFGGAVDSRCGDWPSLIYFVHNYAQLLISLLPAVVGMFLGAPLVAAELEHHTFRYVWTQDVARSRWLRSKLLFLGGFVLVFAEVFAGAYAWWFAPAVTSEGRFDTFDFGLISFPATCLFGFVLGVAAGAVFRRTLPGMAVALAGFLPVLVVVKNWLRPYYLDPVLLENTAGGALRAGDPVFRDAAGVLHGYDEAMAIAGLPRPSIMGTEPSEVLERAGLTRLYPVQPGDRFWLLQLIEAGLFLALAAGCVLLSFCWIRRRLT
ncbi:ABC transporter permease [Amycolatopsis nigrescens]|uniref:ABC transporter permease n=1 Tax=Amycolatopsis nigrescens TaxID=381445 RepID=UPI0003601ACB|nr:ABC transporter permease [Amycolatopsis nigrescens]